MSGDVQPRKRKDKKKAKRDSLDPRSEGDVFTRKSSLRDDEEIKESHHGVHATKMGKDDIHFHVQGDHETGGHWCAKIFFFSLLAILFGLIGLIILENRGSTNLDTPLSESRFSEYFEGWVDEHRQAHDDHGKKTGLEEHDAEPFEEEEDHSEPNEEEEHDATHEDDDDDEEDDLDQEEIIRHSREKRSSKDDNDPNEDDDDNDDEDDEDDDEDERNDEDGDLDFVDDGSPLSQIKKALGEGKAKVPVRVETNEEKQMAYFKKILEEKGGKSYEDLMEELDNNNKDENQKDNDNSEPNDDDNEEDEAPFEEIMHKMVDSLENFKMKVIVLETNSKYINSQQDSECLNKGTECLIATNKNYVVEIGKQDRRIRETNQFRKREEMGTIIEKDFTFTHKIPGDSPINIIGQDDKEQQINRDFSSRTSKQSKLDNVDFSITPSVRDNGERDFKLKSSTHEDSGQNYDQGDSLFIAETNSNNSLNASKQNKQITSRNEGAVDNMELNTDFVRSNNVEEIENKIPHSANHLNTQNEKGTNSFNTCNGIEKVAECSDRKEHSVNPNKIGGGFTFKSETLLEMEKNKKDCREITSQLNVPKLKDKLPISETASQIKENIIKNDGSFTFKFNVRSNNNQPLVDNGEKTNYSSEDIGFSSDKENITNKPFTFGCSKVKYDTQPIAINDLSKIRGKSRRNTGKNTFSERNEGLTVKESIENTSDVEKNECETSKLEEATNSSVYKSQVKQDAITNQGLAFKISGPRKINNRIHWNNKVLTEESVTDKPFIFGYYRRKPSLETQIKYDPSRLLENNVKWVEGSKKSKVYDKEISEKISKLNTSKIEDQSQCSREQIKLNTTTSEGHIFRVSDQGKNNQFTGSKPGHTINDALVKETTTHKPFTFGCYKISKVEAIIKNDKDEGLETSQNPNNQGNQKPNHESNEKSYLKGDADLSTNQSGTESLLCRGKSSTNVTIVTNSGFKNYAPNKIKQYSISNKGNEDTIQNVSLEKSSVNRTPSHANVQTKLDEPRKDDVDAINDVKNTENLGQNKASSRPVGEEQELSSDRPTSKRKEDDDFDDNEDSLEKVVDNDAGEELHLRRKAEQEELAAKAAVQEDEESESAPLAVKIAVGLALAFVARLVLVKKTKPSKPDEPPEEMPHPRRRFTMISPTDDIPVENERLLDEEIDEDYAEEEEEEEEDEDPELQYSEETEELEEDEEDENPRVEKFIPETFEQLNAMYRPKPPFESPVEPQITEKRFEAAITKPTETIPKPFSPSRPPVPKEEPKKIVFDDKPKVSLIQPASDTLQQGSSPKIYSEPLTQYAEEDIDPEEEADEDEEEIDDAELYSDSEEDADEEISDVDDDDLMRRLEEKYGKLPDQKFDSDDEDVDYRSWTKVRGPQSINDDAYIDEEIRRANEELFNDNLKPALQIYESLILKFPEHPGALYGKAKVLDRLSTKYKNNQMLNDAIQAYRDVINLGDKIEDVVFREVAERCLERMRFGGMLAQSVPIHRKLIRRFSDDPEIRNQLAVTYLLQNRYDEAKYILHHTLMRWRDNGFAQVHYGFILKVHDNDYKGAVALLREGIASGANGTQDGRFYFALGEALHRIGEKDEAIKVYREGANLKLFPSAYQRSLYNVNGLKAQPFWTLKETTYAKEFAVLQRNWELIRQEGLSALSVEGFYVDEAESLRDTGDWKQLELFARGYRIEKNCAKAPLTCNIIETFAAARTCKRGQVKFSIMHPGTHVWPHCGPTNCRLRAHLGLVVPPGTKLRVAEEERTWKAGEWLIFDDSFEHEVWHNGTSPRLVLIVDVWHPELTGAQRDSLSRI